MNCEVSGDIVPALNPGSLVATLLGMTSLQGFDAAKSCLDHTFWFACPEVATARALTPRIFKKPSASAWL